MENEGVSRRGGPGRRGGSRIERGRVMSMPEDLRVAVCIRRLGWGGTLDGPRVGGWLRMLMWPGPN